MATIHGLQGDAYESWKHEDGTMWHESILPDKIPFARIMTFGYDSTIAFSSSGATLEDKSIELINRLSIKRSSIEINDLVSNQLPWLQRFQHLLT